MKAMTEFPAHLLNKGIAAKTALTAEGKTEDEVVTQLGETFKYEAEKLKYFVAALDVAEANADKLYRVRVLSFGEGETIPPKAVKVEEAYFLPEFATPPKKVVTVKEIQKNKAGNKNDRNKGPKTSPWGPSPEEIAAKKEASIRAAQAKKK